MALSVSSLACVAADLGPPPNAQKIPVTERIHGIEITDNYRWLEDQNSPATRAWIAAQQKYAEQFFAALPERAKIRGELERFERIEIRSELQIANGEYFFLDRLPNEEQASLYVQKGADAGKQLLIAAGKLSFDNSLSISIADVSRDGRTLAYQLRKGGQDETELHFLDVDRKTELPALPRAKYFYISFSPDGQLIYYSRVAQGGGYRVFRHALDAPAASDNEVFGAAYGPEYENDCSPTVTGHYLVCLAQKGSATVDADLYVQKLGTDPAPRQIAIHMPLLEFATHGDRLYVLSAQDAPNHKVLAIDLAQPSPAQWQEILPEGKVPTNTITIANHRLFTTTLEDVADHLRVFSLDGKPLGEIKTITAGSIPNLAGREDEKEVVFEFSSFAYPSAFFRVTRDSSSTLWWKAVTSLDPSQIDVQHVWYPSKDATRIPMYVLRRKGLSTPRPALLTAYGGFDLPQLPSWSPRIAFWLERGGALALPALRGGGEFGEPWHHAGMLEKKQNVFDDFYAAAEYLIASGLTSRKQLAILGASNGGLLMGAAMTQRPDLFRAVVCIAPLLDMLRYQHFSTAKLWVPEYGSSDDPAQFSYLLKYSPYQHVEAGRQYPAILFVTGDGDTRVDPLHARKMTALLQAIAAPGAPILLRYDVLTGHSGGLSTDKRLDLDSDIYAFLASQIQLPTEDP